ncbi:putative exo-beta-1,3-glucanase [Leptodontidium sp. MPI-SDFR-AT-0119]|nr:putative exo-beta-1,3-glucanase [Leptodontidium sp. MPI-SDFR-AT-0119]
MYASILFSTLFLTRLLSGVVGKDLAASLSAGQRAALYPAYTYVPSIDADWKPDPHGLPIVKLNVSIDPLSAESPVVPSLQISSIPSLLTKPLPKASEFWYEHITHNGISPFITNGSEWKVFRNVKDYGAKGDGVTDDAAAIQAAVSDGGRGGNSLGTTGAPAVIYFPSGTYLMRSSVQSYVDTFFIGNPIDRPTLKASADFAHPMLLYMKDPRFGETINFYIGVKNLILDSTAFPANSPFTLMDYSVSQATQLTNVAFRMPPSSQHTGLATPEGGSGTYMGDLEFSGGLIGINMNNQQYSIKDCSFSGVSTAVMISHGFDLVFQGFNFSNCEVGINATLGGVGNVGSVTLIDSVAESVQVVIDTKSQIVGNTTTGDASIVIDNLETKNVESTVVAGGKTILTGSVPKTWVYGNAYLPGGPVSGAHNAGVTYQTSRSPQLVAGGKYFTMAPPTYQEYSIDQVVNIKSVKDFPVYGDGQTDDTHNINAILARNAGCAITFFPAGTYLVSDTIIVPPGSRIIGEALSAISAVGSKFSDADSPKAMIQVGSPGETGIAQISDMLFTVADVLPGCILVQVNMAGTSPGDVGFWNSHFRIGGAAGSAVQTKCQTGIPCKAAFMLLHLTATSSAYIEDMWGWTADHDLDGNNNQLISTGRGALVESQLGTWLIGTAFEHHTLYQYNFVSASNVLVSMQQSETPYWQGIGGPAQAPAPWTPSDSFSDPTFSHCGTDDPNCRMAWYQRIVSGSNMYIYGSGFWTFFNNVGDCKGVNGTCQDNANEIVGSPTGLFWWNVNTRGCLNVLVDNGVVVQTQNNNPGSWGAVVAATLTYSGLLGRVRRWIG